MAGGGIYLALHVVAAVNRSPLLWGTDSWAFLPALWAYVLLALGIIALVPRTGTLVQPFFLRLSRLLARIPQPVWLISAGVVLYVLRQRTFFLGDGQLRLTNTEAHHLFSLEEPLDTLVHTSLYIVLNPLFGTSGKVVYQGLSILMGVGALWGGWYYLKRLYNPVGRRWFMGGLVATSGAAQLFFGYVESYTIVAALSLMFLFSALLMIKRKKPTPIPAVFLSLAIITHPVAVMLLPAAWYAYRQVIGSSTGMRQTITSWLPYLGTGASIIGAVIIVFWLGGQSPLDFIAHYLSGSNLLPFTARGDRYGMVTAYHFADVANEIGLTIPAGIAIFFLLFRVRSIRWTTSVVFLALASAGMLLFMTVFNPKLGFARDWDIFALAAFPATLFLGEFILETVGKNLFRIAFPLLVIAVLHTVPWIAINASTAASLARIEHLVGTPWWPKTAKALTHDDLGKYWHEQGDLARRGYHYARAFDLAGNRRYYENVVNAYYHLGDLEALRLFVPRDETNPLGYFYLGSALLTKKEYEGALRAFERVRKLDPDYTGVYLQLGRTYLLMNKYEECIAAYREALRRKESAKGNADTGRVDINWRSVHTGLGLAYHQTGRWEEAIEQYREALALEPENAQTHYSIALSCYRAGRDSLARAHADMAERQGYDGGKISALRSLIESGGSGEYSPEK